MYESCKMELKMKRTLLLGGEKKKREFSFVIQTYDEEKEEILAILEDGKLDEVSLDGAYECRIFTNAENLDCMGVVKERYHNEQGDNVRFRVQEGFYKKRIN